MNYYAVIPMSINHQGTGKLPNGNLTVQMQHETFPEHVSFMKTSTEVGNAPMPYPMLREQLIKEGKFTKDDTLLFLFHKVTEFEYDNCGLGVSYSNPPKTEQKDGEGN